MPRPVHRLDKETMSGLVVFARDRGSEGHLGKQFRQHTVERTYLALVARHDCRPAASSLGWLKIGAIIGVDLRPPARTPASEPSRTFES